MRTLISILWISFFPLAAAAQGDDLSYRLKKVIKDKKAEIGIAVILDAQDTVTVNNDDRYPLMSVFKFHQALAVADYLDRNGLTPDTEIFIPEEELDPDTYSPLRKEFPEGEISLSVSRLLEYSLQLSDNNACDILFEHTGGPAATDRYVRSLGLRNFAIAATEQQMHDDPQTCYENWSTPLEAAALLELLVTEQILTPTLREMIRQNLINCKTGADRLPKPLSGTGAVIGHKTGTSDRDERGIFAGTNDLGFVILPDGTRLPGKTTAQNSDSDAGTAEITTKLNKNLPRVEKAEKLPRVGDWVFALGHGGGLDQKRGPMVRLGRVVSLKHGVIQTDCKLIRGDSGGPLFNLNGELIGIHSRVGSGLEDNLHVPMKDFDALMESPAGGKAPLPPSPERDG